MRIFSVCDKDNSKNLTTVNSICSVMKFSGENAIKFLNNLLISDLLGLEKNNYHYTALCNPKGRIISSMWINICSEHQITLICPNNIKNDLLDFFNMRKFRLKLDIQLSKDCVIIQDNKAINIISEFDGTNTKNENENELFYQFVFTNNLPWINKDNTEKFIPQHVNLDQHENIMSFTKGCYPGQEIIARIKYLGKIKKRMQLLNEKNIDLLKNKILDSEPVSPIIHITSKDTYFVHSICSTSE